MFDLRGCRHPVVENIPFGQSFVPNDIVFGIIDPCLLYIPFRSGTPLCDSYGSKHGEYALSPL